MMKLPFIFSIIVACIPLFLASEELFLSVTLFDHLNKQGPNMTLEIRGCKNLPLEWADRVSSLQLHGSCIRIFKDDHCTGRMMSVTPENRLWLNDLRKVSFNDMLSSVSSCKPESPPLESGRYVIQNPWDKGVLTVRRLVGGYTMLKTNKWKKDLAQQWDIEKNIDDTFLLTPRMFEHNSMTYHMNPTQKFPTERIFWKIESLFDQMYVLRKHPTNLCLTMRPKMEPHLTACRKEEQAQQWIFHKLRGALDD